MSARSPIVTLRFSATLAILALIAGSHVSHGDSAPPRPVALGLGLGYAEHSSSRYGDDPLIHGRQVQLFARLRNPRAHLQPRLEFLSQSYDLDASRLSQATWNIQVVDGDRRVRAAVASLEWNLGHPRPLRLYLVAGGGRAWIRDRLRWNDGARNVSRDDAWLASAGLGLAARIGAYGAFVEARALHVYDGATGFDATNTETLTAGLVF